jgi:stage II sporulation protein AA (anti-sigma F factor antagonist)
MRERFRGEQFRASVEAEGVTLLVHLFGELDLSGEAIFDKEVREFDKSGFKQVLFDLSGITFIDSSGLWLLFVEIERCRHFGLDVAMLQVSDETRAMLATTGLYKKLPIVDAYSPYWPV